MCIRLSYLPYLVELPTTVIAGSPPTHVSDPRRSAASTASPARGRVPFEFRDYSDRDATETHRAASCSPDLIPQP